MKFIQALLPILVGLAGGVQADKCPKGAHIISVRGDGERQGHAPNGGIGFGMVGHLVNDLKLHIPGSSATWVPYPQQGKLITTNTVAVHHLKHHIKNFARRCPHNKIIIAGYSEGAGVTMNALCGTLNNGWNFTYPLNHKRWSKHIAAIVVYGDFTRAQGQPYNRGTCHHNSPWPRQHNINCHRWTSKLRSVCHAADPICCNTGHDITAHHSYFALNDPEISSWATSRYHFAMKSKN